VNTAPATWTVRDGLLHCTGKPTGQLRTTRMYQNFVLELEWRHLDPGGNAGVFVWADDITARGVPFQRSIEVQVLDHGYGNTRSHTTHGDIFPIHGASMKPINGRGGSRAFPTEKRSKPSPAWNHYSITCNDGSIALAVNGKVVTRGEACTPRKGYICLESEGGRVDYRNVRVKELPETPVEAEHVATADRGYTSLYSGLDLSDWTATGEWQVRDWTLVAEATSAAEPATLTRELDATTVGFVVDVKLGAASTSVHLTLGSTTLEINAGTPGKRDGWNRIEGELRAASLTHRLNGVARPTQRRDPAAQSLTLQLATDGRAEWANVFVRSLE